MSKKLVVKKVANAVSLYAWESTVSSMKIRLTVTTQVAYLLIDGAIDNCVSQVAAALGDKVATTSGECLDECHETA